MKKDEIIELLKEQIKGLRDDNNRLLDQIDALIKEVSSLKEALLQKGESLSKQQRLTKGLAKLVSNTSEQQQAPQSAISEEERQKIEAEKADKRKARKNNGAKRDMHYEMEEEEHVVYPDDPDFDINKARLFTTVPRICVRYECVPMRFIKHVYKIHTYTQEGRLFEGKTPASAFLNSSYDGSFIAGLMELRYIQSLPVERIINYFESHGFTLKKPTAHKLIEKASSLFENLYKCIRQTALSDPYKAADETYYKILVPEKNSKGKGVRKGYLWVVVGINTRMIYLLYDDGSQSELEKSKSIYEYGSYVYYETGSPAFWRRHCQLSVSGKIPDVTCPVPAVGTCRNSCRTCHHPGQVVVPASGCRFHTSSSFFQRRDRKRKGRKSPALPSRYGRDNYQILLLVLQFPCLWRSRFRQDQIHRQTLMEQYIRSGFAGFIYDFKDFDYTRTAYNLIRKHGYPHEFYYVNFTDMNRTYRFNPLDRRNIKEGRCSCS